MGPSSGSGASPHWCHRRINTAGVPETFLGHDNAVQVFPHAVKTLKFEIETLPGQFRNHCNGMRIVGCELGVKSLPVGEHLPGAGDKGNIGIRLARENRVALETLYLRMLDFRVPIRTLHQAEGDSLAAA